MNVVNVKVEKLNLSASTADERHSWIAGKVTNECAEIVVRVEPDHDCRVRETRQIRFESSAQIAALEDALHVMRVRLADMEQAGLMKPAAVEYVVAGAPAPQRVAGADLHT